MPPQEKPIEKFQFRDLAGFLKSRLLVYNLIRIGIFLLLLWLLHSLLLNLYTNHGQKLKLANYIGLPLDRVRKASFAKDYELIITDSIHLIGKPGGFVLNQVPKPNSFVKRGRKVYITISRYNADVVLSDNLPTLYGEKFEFKKQEFESLLQLKLICSGTRYDPGPTGHILEARYRGQLLADEKIKTTGVSIEKGDSIQVIISVNEGGEMDVPNLHCKTLAEAKFELEAASLTIGHIDEEGPIDNPEDAYIIFQNPSFERGRKIKMNSSIQVTISQTFPSDCEPR